MGQEGFGMHMYLIRSSHEDFRCEGFTFKVEYKAVMQVSESQNESSVQASKNDAKAKIVMLVETKRSRNNKKSAMNEMSTVKRMSTAEKMNSAKRMNSAKGMSGEKKVGDGTLAEDSCSVD